MNQTEKNRTEQNGVERKRAEHIQTPTEKNNASFFLFSTEPNARATKSTNKQQQHQWQQRTQQQQPCIL